MIFWLFMTSFQSANVNRERNAWSRALSRENLFNSAILAHFNFVSAYISCFRRFPRVITMDSESDTEGLSQFWRTEWLWRPWNVCKCRGKCGPRVPVSAPLLTRQPAVDSGVDQSVSKIRPDHRRWYIRFIHWWGYCLVSYWRKRNFVCLNCLLWIAVVNFYDRFIEAQRDLLQLSSTTTNRRFDILWRDYVCSSILICLLCIQCIYVILICLILYSNWICMKKIIFFIIFANL